MDRKFNGLRCTYLLLDSLNPDDAFRITGLQQLILGRRVPYNILINVFVSYNEYSLDRRLVVFMELINPSE